MRTQIYNPDEGQAFQGDVAIVPMPADIRISELDEIKPVAGRLILQEGEVTGHHHAIVLPRERNSKPSREAVDPSVQTRSQRLRKAFGSTKSKTGTARMYRDPAAVEELVRRKILTRSDLAVGLLIVEGAPVKVEHEEHDAQLIPPGNYYVGRQVESVGAEERIVAD